jgi:hypothetical protein
MYVSVAQFCFVQYRYGTNPCKQSGSQLIREVNGGVLQELKMRSVYEKTLALLYRGSKNAANNNADAQVSCRFLWSAFELNLFSKDM